MMINTFLEQTILPYYLFYIFPSKEVILFWPIVKAGKMLIWSFKDGLNILCCKHVKSVALKQKYFAKIDWTIINKNFKRTWSTTWCFALLKKKKNNNTDLKKNFSKEIIIIPIIISTMIEFNKKKKKKKKSIIIPILMTFSTRNLKSLWKIIESNDIFFTAQLPILAGWCNNLRSFCYENYLFRIFKKTNWKALQKNILNCVKK